ncbi:MAG: M28 family peptidase [Candidatus Latescibacteria bacterium]|nr:M28 family peptidase [Candidatus Latescibacterota bacterium]
MIRRDFISSIAVTAFTAKFCGGCSPQQSANPAATPEKRAQYLQTMLKRLCTDIGPHPTGSPEFKKAAEIIYETLKEAAPNTELDEYRFEKWEPVGSAECEIGGQKIETVLHHGCVGTPPEGWSGILIKSESGGFPWRLVDESTGNELAHIRVAPFGPAIPNFGGFNSIQKFTVDTDKESLLDDAVENKVTCRFKAQAQFVADSRGYNIVGSIPGKTSDEIMFLAHADTVYTSPGANDNTASMIVMLMLAHAFSGTTQKYTLTFVATDGEEYGLLGAQHYADRRKEEGTLGNIKFITNFDSLTYGPNLWITSEDNELNKMLVDINNDLGINGTPRVTETTGFVLDNEPFRESGARAVNMNSRGYDEKTLPLYHRPEDTAETVHVDCVENSFLVFREYIERIMVL